MLVLGALKQKIDIEDITFKNTRIDDENFYVFDHKKLREKSIVCIK